MIYNYLINGSSSLLFVISTIKSFYSSTFLLLKISNIFLIVASFFCNATECSQPFIYIDYFAICLVCLCYLNNIYITILYTLLFIYEYKKYKTIENIKNITVLSTMIKANIYTYLYVDTFHYIILFMSTIFSIIIYQIRYFLYKSNNNKYYLLLTYFFHICIMNILYISSITAI
jgi:hypothetical protein